MIEPDQLRLLGDSAERAAGLYRFQIVGDSAPSVAPGQLIYGKVESTPYLRRVTRVERGPGATVRITTMEGFWHEVVRGGTYTIHSAIPSFAEAPSGSAAGPSLAPVPLPDAGITLKDVNLCTRIQDKLGFQLCGKERVLVEKGFIEIDGRLDSLFLDSASVQLSGDVDASYTLAAGGDIIPGTGRAPVFSPCDAYPNVTGCFSRVGSLLQSFLISVGINPNVLPPLRLCIPGTPITVRAGSLFPFRLPVIRICRITDYGALPEFTLPSMSSVNIVIRPHIVAGAVIDVAGSGSLKLQIPIPELAVVKCFDHGNGLFCVKAGLFIVVKFGFINAGGKVLLSDDETERITLKWDPVGGWDNGFETLSESRQATFAPVNSVDTLFLRLGPAVELSADLCFGSNNSSCADANDPNKSTGGTFFDLHFGVKGKATVGHYEDAVWSRDGTPFDNWKVDIDGLNELEFEAGITLPKILLQLPDKNLKRSWPFQCCRLSIQDLHGTGALDIQTITTGAAPDPDGYTVTVERADTLPGIGEPGATRLGTPNWGAPIFASIGLNETIRLDPSRYCVTSYSDALFTLAPSLPGSLLPGARRLGLGIPNYAYELGCELLIADYVVTLSGVADNCTVNQLPADPVRLQQIRFAPIPRPRLSKVILAVNCPPYAGTPGALDVTTNTTGFTLDPDGYRILLDGEDQGAVPTNGQVTVGSLNPGAGRALDLTGLSPNCAISGTHPVSVDIAAAATAAASFDIFCGPIAVPETAPGNIRISTTTEGSPQDPDGYAIALNGAQAGLVGNNAQLLLSGLNPGHYDVELRDLAPNCSVASGSGVDVLVPPGGTVDVGYPVRCVSVAGGVPTGSLKVVVVTSGSDPDADGYVLAVGTLMGPIGVHDSVTATEAGVGPMPIRLDGVAAHCAVQGANPRSETVVANVLTRVEIEVACATRAKVTLSTVTIGTDPDPDGFRVILDGVDVGAIGLQGSLQLLIAPGSHALGLSDLTPNCAVQGTSPATLDLAPGAVAAVNFTVDCIALASLGGVDVKVVTGGKVKSGAAFTVVMDRVAQGTVVGRGSLLVPNVRPGEHIFELDGVPAECRIAGKYPKVVNVPRGVTVHTTFTVVCK